VDKSEYRKLSESYHPWGIKNGYPSNFRNFKGQISPQHPVETIMEG